MKFKKLFPSYPVSISATTTAEAIKTFEHISKEMPEFSVDLTTGEETLNAESADDFSMYIRHDLNSDLKLVYQGIITTYCPTEENKTAYFEDVKDCLKSLSTLYKNLMQAK